MSLVCHSLGSVQKLKVAAKQGNIRLPEHTRSLFRIAQKNSYEFSVSDKKIVTRCRVGSPALRWRVSSMSTGAQRRFCLPAGLRGAERRCGSFSDPQRRAAGWVGAMWRSIAPARATIPPPHSTLEDQLSHYDGGAQDFISTGSNHRRRNRSPAWLLAPRSAQRSRR